jgi:stage III sporulation protein SpoIIIAA
MARVLSATHNVVVIDISIEVDGDGSLSHDSIGSCRRMMVPIGARQQEVLIECVENRSPQVIVMDEIGHVEQVKAAQTVKDRGVRMIATARRFEWFVLC